jgi:hypothetical protein
VGNCVLVDCEDHLLLMQYVIADKDIFRDAGKNLCFSLYFAYLIDIYVLLLSIKLALEIMRIYLRMITFIYNETIAGFIEI